MEKLVEEVKERLNQMMELKEAKRLNSVWDDPSLLQDSCSTGTKI